MSAMVLVGQEDLGAHRLIRERSTVRNGRQEGILTDWRSLSLVKDGDIVTGF